MQETRGGCHMTQSDWAPVLRLWSPGTVTTEPTRGNCRGRCPGAPALQGEGPAQACAERLKGGTPPPSSKLEKSVRSSKDPAQPEIERTGLYLLVRNIGTKGKNLPSLWPINIYIHTTLYFPHFAFILILHQVHCQAKTQASWDFPGGPVVKIMHFQCRGHRFNPWSGN